MNYETAFAALQRGTETALTDMLAKLSHHSPRPLIEARGAYRECVGPNGFDAVDASIRKALSVPMAQRVTDGVSKATRKLASDANATDARANPKVARRPASASDQLHDSIHDINDPQGIKAAQRSIRALYAEAPQPQQPDRAGSDL